MCERSLFGRHSSTLKMSIFNNVLVFATACFNVILFYSAILRFDTKPSIIQLIGRNRMTYPKSPVDLTLPRPFYPSFNKCLKREIKKME